MSLIKSEIEFGAKRWR